MHDSRCQGATTPALAPLPADERLTAREREIALLAARGHGNGEIASELVLSVRSVETYILRACRKLGVDRRTSLPEALRVDSRRCAPQIVVVDYGRQHGQPGAECGAMEREQALAELSTAHAVAYGCIRWAASS